MMTVLKSAAAKIKWVHRCFTKADPAIAKAKVPFDVDGPMGSDRRNARWFRSSLNL
jgi:hypothetical protein